MLKARKLGNKYMEGQEIGQKKSYFTSMLTENSIKGEIFNNQVEWMIHSINISKPLSSTDSLIAQCQSVSREAMRMEMEALHGHNRMSSFSYHSWYECQQKKADSTISILEETRLTVNGRLITSDPSHSEEQSFILINIISALESVFLLLL